MDHIDHVTFAYKELSYHVPWLQARYYTGFMGNLTLCVLITIKPQELQN